MYIAHTPEDFRKLSEYIKEMIEPTVNEVFKKNAAKYSESYQDAFNGSMYQEAFNPKPS